ncbi:RHS repeat domain-containing protein [Neisseria sp. 83E34]|uniref:RHS repeat domain-containing protein n=1 Tax=Neisseria sp. 83E34 TaxID=1692264 RepID=UPI000B2EA4E6|nr:RHS repeat-associated core domain-containing protein [Neisseria sp. 83E34]
MGRLKNQTATANRTLQHNGKLNTLVGGAVRRSYRYDKAGNLIQTADQRSGVLDYVYDKLGRIESAVNKQTGRSEKFAFDPAHNILSDNVSDGLKDTKGLSENLSDRHHTGRIKGRNIGKGNRLEAYNGIEYTYDALGNMIYRQLPNGESQYFVYDTENRLIRTEIKKPAGNTEVWEYAYDPFGRRLSKERKDKLEWTSTAPKRTHFVWDGTRLLQEYNYKGSYTYIYTDQDSYEPLAQIFDNHKDRQQYLFYFHNNQIGTPHEMTDIHGNLLWYGSYSAWGSLASEKRIYENVHQPFRLQNQYFDSETGLHYNFFRYYEAETGRFTNQDPIGLEGGTNLYQFAPNAQSWTDALGLWAFLPYVAAGLAAIGRAAISVLSKAARAGKKAAQKCVGKCGKKSNKFSKLSDSDKKSIRSYEKLIDEHKKKIEEFKKNPTVRPGMENLPKDIIKKQQEGRIKHWEKEIKAFQKNISDIMRKYE